MDTLITEGMLTLEEFKAKRKGSIKAYSSNGAFKITSYIVERSKGRRVYGFWSYTNGEYIESAIAR